MENVPYQSLFQAIAEQSGEGISLTDARGSYILVNPAFCKMTGYSQAELLAMNVRDLVPAETGITLIPGIVEGISGQREIELLRKNGSRFLAEIREYTVQFAGEPLVLGIIHDITSRKQTEDRLVELAEFNRNIVASAPVGIVTLDRRGQVTSANDAFLKIVGSPSLEETLKLGMGIPSVKKAAIDTIFNKVLTNGQPLNLDKLPYTSHWGKELIVNLKIVPQKTKDGRISGIIVVVDDVTAEARAEVLQTAVYRIAQAADHASSLEDLFPTIHEIVKAVMPADNFYIALYDEAADMLHFPYYVDEQDPDPRPPRRPRKGWTEYTLRHGVPQLVNAGQHQTMVTQGEVELLGPCAAVWLGVPLIVGSRAIGVMAVQHYQDPHVYGERERHMLEYVASQVAQTIDRKQKEEALRRSGVKLRSLARLAQKLEQARNHLEIVKPLQEEIQTVLGYRTAWIYLFDEDRNYWWLLSSAGEKSTDLLNQAQILRVKGDVFLEEIAETSHIVVVEDARTDPRINKEIVAQLDNRTIVNVPVILENERLGCIATGSFGDEGVRIPSQAGLEYLKAVARHVAVVIDRIQFLIERVKSEKVLQASNEQLQAALAELRQTQERMVQRERLAAVGQLAAGMAHDFNNIMAVIVLYTETGLRLPNLPPKVKEYLQTILHQSWRATELVEQILDFSRRAVLEPRPLNLTPFMKEQVKLLTRTLPENIRLDLFYEADDHIINADPTRMQQVIVNLIVNARDAMPDGGKLHLSLSQVTTTGEPVCVVCQQPIVGKWVRIRVEDNGSGIPPAVLPHIFEPFFTTKQVGQGAGLGLSQVAGIVDQHGGHITIKSQEGEGTTFMIYLPALAVKPQRKLLAETAVVPHGAGETILVVEDDAAARAALAESIELLNYRVLTAANGLEALTVLEQCRHEIELVLSDLVMPEMGGQALFQELRQRDPKLPVVMLSGHPLEGDLKLLQKEGLAGWLFKPPDMKKLANLLTQALGQKDKQAS